MKILIGADVVVTDNNRQLFMSGETHKIIDEKIKEEIDSADFRIYNLETPISDISAPIFKCGPNLIAPADAIKGIKKLNPSLLLLSNNHILDHGEDALKDTINILNENSIDYMGAGKNLSDAKKPYITNIDGKKIGIYNCCEHEFSIAGEDSWGANPFDPLESLDDISELKKECDFLIVFYHGGKEHYRYPSGELQKICRKIADKGADAVICQHSHCVGCFEDYNNSKIIYGQGNFIFTRLNERMPHSWDTSILVEIIINDKKVEYNYIPFCVTETGARIANETESKEIIDGFYKRSEEIKDKDFLKKKYDEFCASMVDKYLNFIGGGTFSVPEEIPELTDNYKNYLVGIYNYLICEAHTEVLINGIKNKLY